MNFSVPDSANGGSGPEREYALNPNAPNMGTQLRDVRRKGNEDIAKAIEKAYNEFWNKIRGGKQGWGSNTFRGMQSWHP